MGKEAKQMRELIEGAVGEFDHAVLLRQYIGEPEAAEAAAHWKGGWYHVYEHKKEMYPVLAYASEWDSPEAAQTYFRLYSQVLQQKWKELHMTSRTPEEMTGTGDSGRFILKLMGTKVEVIEGLR